MRYLSIRTTLQLCVLVHAAIAYGLATDRSLLVGNGNIPKHTVKLQQRSIDSSNLTNLTKRNILFARPINQCPGPNMDENYSNFRYSFCSSTRQRDYWVSCAESGGARWKSYEGSCHASEVCSDNWAPPGLSIAYCIDFVDLGQSYLSSSQRDIRRIHGPVADEAQAIQTDQEGAHLVDADRGPKDSVDTFQVLLAGQDYQENQDTLFWAKHLTLQPMRNGRDVGSAAECDDCYGTSISPWPGEANHFRVKVDVKNRFDVLRIVWARLLLPGS